MCESVKFDYITAIDDAKTKLFTAAPRSKEEKEARDEWEELSYKMVSKVTTEDELVKAYCYSPNGSKAEILANKKLYDLRKNKS